MLYKNSLTAHQKIGLMLANLFGAMTYKFTERLLSPPGLGIVKI
jgi:hypothetical protein